MLRSNVGSNGNVDTHAMMRALLQYRNTPTATTGMSPAYMFLGRQLRGALPTLPSKHDPSTMSYAEKYGRPSPLWTDIRNRREIAYAKKRADTMERYNADKHHLEPLSVGDSVSI